MTLVNKVDKDDWVQYMNDYTSLRLNFYMINKLVVRAFLN